MTNIQLNAGELWELGGERHYFEQVRRIHRSHFHRHPGSDPIG